MKQPPKPFAIEIKRSRRSASAPQVDFFGKEGSIASGAGLNGAGASASRRRDAAPERTSASELAVPAFLQAGRRSAPDRLSDEAAQVFAPKPPSHAGRGPDERAPRILPSLAPPDAAVEAPAQAGEPPRAARAPKGAARGRPAATAKSAAKRRVDEAAAAADARPKSKPEARSAALASPPPAPAAEAAENDTAQLGARRGARARSFLRRREDAAALPPGQHWKRRLSPHAW